MLPFTATRGGRDRDYNPHKPLVVKGEQFVIFGGGCYEEKINSQSYLQVIVIGSLGSILVIDVPHSMV